jgi:hypothetical protein
MDNDDDDGTNENCERAELEGCVFLFVEKGGGKAGIMFR